MRTATHVTGEAPVTKSRLRPVNVLLLLGALALLGPFMAYEAVASSRSVGSAHKGQLVNGFELPLDGQHHAFFGPVEERKSNFATLELAALIGRAARVVAAALPGGQPLILGDCSVAGGGDIKRHVSHRSGRDVDMLFFRVDRGGASVLADGFLRFDGRGHCRSRKPCDTRIDVPRTWWLLRTLLASQEPAVQYVFVSRPIRRLLLAYAQSRGEHPELIQRAKKIMRQPRSAAKHDDHIHLRTYCTPEDQESGCVDHGPRWPWVSEDGLASPLGR